MSRLSARRTRALTRPGGHSLAHTAVSVASLLTGCLVEESRARGSAEAALASRPEGGGCVPVPLRLVKRLDEALYDWSNEVDDEAGDDVIDAAEVLVAWCAGAGHLGAQEGSW